MVTRQLCCCVNALLFGLAILVHATLSSDRAEWRCRARREHMDEQHHRIRRPHERWRRNCRCGESACFRDQHPRPSIWRDWHGHHHRRKFRRGPTATSRSVTMATARSSSKQDRKSAVVPAPLAITLARPAWSLSPTQVRRGPTAAHFISVR